LDAREEGYTRRISAVLLADLSGYSALMGEDDERTARDIRRLQGMVRAIVVELQGTAEPQAGDSICATFESVVSAVEAALRIHRRLADDEHPERRLRLRIGIHFGDVLVMQGGGALGDAINVAARLCALARPGTVCISAGVYRHVRGRFEEPIEDLGRQRLKNISDPVHAYLIVPQSAGAVRRRRRALPWLYASAAILAFVSAFAMWSVWPKRARSVLPVVPAARVEAAAEKDDMPPDEASEVTLGVMLFKPLREDPEHLWMRDALRDGLNTQLSGLSKVKVYAKEFLDLLITREGLSEIEAADRLGISKMLSGSFVAVGDTLRIETHVVDVKTGRLEASTTTTGPVAQFLSLQTKMTEGVIARLDIPITPEERRTLLAQQNTDLEALKMLLEAEGGGGGGAAPPGSGSFLWRWIEQGLDAAPAWADDRTDIAALIERYRQATEARDVGAIGAVFVEFSPEQQAAQQRYFDNTKDLKVAIADVEAVVVGDEAVAGYTRTDDFTDARTGRPMHVQVRLSKTLRRTGEGWRIAAGK
jgi:class 3 adenylate cyclase/TolB-like protein/ketosteroid isomerase-like protein